ncbi:hypothetical protein M9H77_36292 [Catharanthus roseus]|uniref:Uncharacterized protein n=1 Tax=Catharanthus roseus TaxID=4058 RepID=A0ACB9ZRD5_CATRO|nr:hypothetical protein M9H77_36292 [Catharanthus roseus]
MLANFSQILLKQPRNIMYSAQFVLQFRTFNLWSSAIRNASSSQGAMRIYIQMQRQGVPYESFSILFAIRACTDAYNLPIIRHFHAHIVKLGFSNHVYVATSLLNAYIASSIGDAWSLFDEMPERNIVSWNTMITGFSRCGLVGKARKVFDEMPSRDLSSWSAMISGYFSNRLWDEGLLLFQEMLMIEGLKPDQVTIGSGLADCGRMGSIGLVVGKSIHGYVIKNRWELNVELGTCLVDMYAKCGVLKSACLVFDMMKERNVVAWTALICGFAQRSSGKEALQIFEMMRKSGVGPNQLTFTGVLSACAQEGLVEDGRAYFRLMEVYGLTPTIQHYGCMVDLFGKAGLLGEAFDVTRTMPMDPNVVIWGSFLTSCKLHKQFQMAERVIDHVLRTIRPENDGGVYTLISDLYVLSGKWSDAERIRALMLNQKVKKARGSSFIRSRANQI